MTLFNHQAARNAVDKRPLTLRLGALVLSTPICSINDTLDAAASKYTITSQDYDLSEEVNSYGAIHCGLHRIDTGDCIKYTHDGQVSLSNDHFNNTTIN